jgi:hypothetical protein
MTPDAGAAAIGRLALTKTYSGDLVGGAVGHMLSVTSDAEGSAAYVALERIEAEIAGRSGTFDLVHRGIMDRGRPSLDVSIVPDSGTGALAGISGTLTIEIIDGSHVYELTYELD